MEKAPLRGNASIPMSFPTSYHAVDDQVTTTVLCAFYVLHNLLELFLTNSLNFYLARERATISICVSKL